MNALGEVPPGQETREKLRLMRATLGGEHDPMGPVWRDMPQELRARLLLAAGHSWVGVSGYWHEIPAQCRAEIKRRAKLLRDELLRVFPLEPDPGGEGAG